MSKSISIKVEKDLLVETQKLLSSLKISRDKYISEAIAYYNKFRSNRMLKNSLAKESKLTAKESLKVLSEFESLND